MPKIDLKKEEQYVDDVVQWFGIAWATCMDKNVDVELALAIVHIESRGDPGAMNPADPSYGLMALKWTTALDMLPWLEGGDYRQLFVPGTNILAGVTYLDWIQRKSKWHPRDRRDLAAMYVGGFGGYKSTAAQQYAADAIALIYAFYHDFVQGAII